MNDSLISIVDAISDDVFSIRHVQKITWLATYPNKKYGITQKDIESKFTNDNLKIGRQKIEERKKQFSDSTIHTFVVKDRNIIIGFCGLKKERDNNKIGALYLLPEYQNKGIGKKLLGIALNWLGNDKDIYVNVASYNEYAIRFYKKFGFVETNKIVSDDAAVLPSGKTVPEIEMIKSKSYTSTSDEKVSW